MLYKNFDWKDNDYITIMSQIHIMNTASPTICKYMQALARLGQVNAMSMWYLVADHQDKEIDSKVLSLGDGPEELHAKMSYYDYMEDGEQTYRNYQRAIDDKTLFTFFGLGLPDEERRERIESSRQAERKYEAQLNKGKWKECRDKTYSQYIHYANYNKDAQFYFIIGLYEFQIHNKKWDKEKVIEEFKQYISPLVKVYKKHPNNPTIKFMLAKSILYTSKSPRKRDKAMAMLNELSHRELSQNLIDYVNNDFNVESNK